MLNNIFIKVVTPISLHVAEYIIHIVYGILIIYMIYVECTLLKVLYLKLSPNFPLLFHNYTYLITQHLFIHTGDSRV